MRKKIITLIILICVLLPHFSTYATENEASGLDPESAAHDTNSENSVSESDVSANTDGANVDGANVDGAGEEGEESVDGENSDTQTDGIEEDLSGTEFIITTEEIFSAGTIIYQKEEPIYLIDYSMLSDIYVAAPYGTKRDEIFFEFSDPDYPTVSVCTMENGEKLILETRSLRLIEASVVVPPPEVTPASVIMDNLPMILISVVSTVLAIFIISCFIIAVNRNKRKKAKKANLRKTMSRNNIKRLNEHKNVSKNRRNHNKKRKNHERKDYERRKAEIRNSDIRNTERRNAERRNAERRNAERRNAERRDFVSTNRNVSSDKIKRDNTLQTQQTKSAQIHKFPSNKTKKPLSSDKFSERPHQKRPK